MASADDVGRRWGSRLRMAAWGMAAFLLLLPAVAMQFTSEISWDETDFILMGVLLFGSAGAFHLLTRTSDSLAHTLGIAVWLGGTFLLIWVNLAAGIIGTEDNPANAMYLYLLGGAAVGAIVARARPNGMAAVMLLAAAAQALIGAIAVMGGLGAEDPNWPIDAIGASAMFSAIWLAAAGLFRWAGRESPAGASRE